jgi:hypothetical protein
MPVSKTPFDGIIISHLGNINGRSPEKENRLAYVNAALKAGWHVLVDVRFHNGGFYLPHAAGFDCAPPAFFSKQRVWSRAADPETLDALCNIGAHALVASDAPFTLTSSQFIWTLPGNPLALRAIAAYPELGDAAWLDLYEPAGLCSNEPAAYI